MQLMDALAELPADLLLFHVCLPLTLPYLNIRSAPLPALCPMSSEVLLALSQSAGS